METLLQALGAVCDRGRGAHCYVYKDNKHIRTKSFGELKKTADAVAAYFTASGLDGIRVALMLPACFARLSAFFGLFGAGCSVVVLPEEQNDESVFSMIRDAGAQAVICTAAKAEDLLSFSAVQPDTLRLIVVGSHVPEGCTAFGDVLACQGQPLPADIGGDGSTVFFPAENGTPEYTYQALLSLVHLDAPAVAGEVSMSLLPFSTPHGAALAFQLLLHRCALAEASYSAFRRTAAQLRPARVFADAAGCIRLYQNALDFARAVCDKRTTQDAVISYFGGNVRQTVCVNGQINVRWVRNYSCAGVPLVMQILPSETENAALSPARTEPVTPSERQILAAAETYLGLQNADLNDCLLSCGLSSAEIAAFALRLHLLPQTVYDCPFLFALAVQLRQEKYLISPLRLHAELLLRKKPTPLVKFTAGAVFLTDGESFFGAHLLHALLASGQKVYCLVRDKQAFFETYAYYFGKIKPQRIKLVLGDLSQPYFGLSATEARKYKGNIDAVIHVADCPADYGPYRTYFDAVVARSQTAVDFARMTGTILEYVSDLRVFGSGRVRQRAEDVVADEQMLCLGQKTYEDGFVHGLFDAEQTVLLARLMGAKTNIFRMGQLAPRYADGRDAYMPSRPSFGEMMNAVVRTGAICGALDRFPQEVLPVDAAADAAVRLMLAGYENRVFHLTGPQKMRVSDLLAKAGLTLPRVSNARFFAQVSKLAENAGCQTLRDAFFFCAAAGYVEIDSRRTAALSGLAADIRCVWDKPYLNRWLKAEPGHVSDAWPAFYPPDAYRIRDGLHTCVRHPLLRQGKDSLLSLPQMLRGMNASRPLLASDTEKNLTLLENVCPGAQKILVDLSAPDAVALLAQTIRAQNADALISAGDEAFLTVAGEASLLVRRGSRRIGLQKSRGAFYMVAVPLPLGTGEMLSSCDPPDAVVCDPAPALEAEKESLSGQIAQMLVNAVEGYLSPAASVFPEDAYFAPGAVAAVFRNAPAVAAGCAAAKEISALQTATVHAGLVCRRVGFGMIRAISDTAFSLFGLPRDAVTAACALPVLRTQTAECAPALSVLAAASGIASDEAGDKENAESFLSALDRLLYSTLGFQRTLPCLQEEDLRRLVVESLDALCNCGTSPRYCEEEWTLILSRIFLDNRK